MLFRSRNNISRNNHIFRYDVPDYTVDLDYDWMSEGDITNLKEQEKNRIPGHPEFPNAGKGDFRPATRPVGAVIPNFCIDGRVGTDCIVPFRPLPVETSVAQLNFMSGDAPQTFTIKATKPGFRGRFRIVQTSKTEYLKITPSEGEIKYGQDIKVTVTIMPEKIRQARMSNTAILVRMENGLSRPVSVYVDSRRDMEKVKNDRKDAIFGNITIEENNCSITFDVPEDGRYYFFVQGRSMGAAPVIKVDGEQKKDWIFYGQPGEGVKWCVLGYNLGLNKPEVLKAGRHTVTILKTGNADFTVKNVALARTPEEMMLAVFTD